MSLPATPSCPCGALRQLAGAESVWTPQETGFETRTIEHDGLNPRRRDLFGRCPVCGTRWRAFETYDAQDMWLLYRWVPEEWDEGALLRNAEEAERERIDARARRRREEAARERAARPRLAPETPADHGLLAAARAGDAAGVRHALAAGADPDVSDETGATALILGVRSGDVQVVDALLMAGADFTARDSAGRTALESARRAREDGIVKLLDPSNRLSVEGPVWRLRPVRRPALQELLAFSFEAASLLAPRSGFVPGASVESDTVSEGEGLRERRRRHGTGQRGIEVVLAETYSEGFADGWRSEVKSLTAYGLPAGCELELRLEDDQLALVVQGPGNARRAVVLRLETLAAGPAAKPAPAAP